MSSFVLFLLSYHYGVKPKRDGKIKETIVKVKCGTVLCQYHPAKAD